MLAYTNSEFHFRDFKNPALPISLIIIWPRLKSLIKLLPDGNANPLRLTNRSIQHAPGIQLTRVNHGIQSRVRPQRRLSRHTLLLWPRWRDSSRTPPAYYACTDSAPFHPPWRSPVDMCRIP